MKCFVNSCLVSSAARYNMSGLGNAWLMGQSVGMPSVPYMSLVPVYSLLRSSITEG